jgi:hypothetical protein
LNFKFYGKNQKLNEIFDKSVDNRDLPFDFFENQTKSRDSHQPFSVCAVPPAFLAHAVAVAGEVEIWRKDFENQTKSLKTRSKSLINRSKSSKNRMESSLSLPHPAPGLKLSRGRAWAEDKRVEDRWAGRTLTHHPLIGANSNSY